MPAKALGTEELGSNARAVIVRAMPSRVLLPWGQPAWALPFGLSLAISLAVGGSAVKGSNRCVLLRDIHSVQLGSRSEGRKRVARAMQTKPLQWKPVCPAH